MVKGQSQIFPSGPPVVRRAIGEQLDKEELGGAQMHVHDSGQVDNEAESEASIIASIERYMATPGQAVSYKIGQLKIQELRKENKLKISLEKNSFSGAQYKLV